MQVPRDSPVLATDIIVSDKATPRSRLVYTLPRDGSFSSGVALRLCFGIVDVADNAAQLRVSAKREGPGRGE